MYDTLDKQLKEGITYVIRHPVIGVLVFVAAAMSLFGISAVTIFPAWAVHPLLGFALSKVLTLSLIFVSLMGVAQIMILNLSNSLIHSEVEDRLRGRVASIFRLTFFGLRPVGGLIMGL